MQVKINKNKWIRVFTGYFSSANVFFFYIAEAFQFNVDDVMDSTFARVKSANEKLAGYYFAR